MFNSITPEEKQCQGDLNEIYFFFTSDRSFTVTVVGQSSDF